MPEAVFLPPRRNFLDALIEAVDTPHPTSCNLYTNGRRMAWLPVQLPGRFKTPATVIERERIAT